MKNIFGRVVEKYYLCTQFSGKSNIRQTILFYFKSKI